MFQFHGINYVCLYFYKMYYISRIKFKQQYDYHNSNLNLT